MIYFINGSKRVSDNLTLLTKFSKPFYITIILLLFSVTSVDAEKPEQMVEDLYKPKQEETNKDTNKDNNTETNTETNKSNINESPAPSKSSSLTFADFFRAIAATIFVVALLYFMLRFINKKSKSYQKGNIIKNLGGTSLGGNKSIQIVKIGRSLYIVGVGEDVQLLGEVTNENDIEEIVAEYNAVADNTLIPSDIFSKIFQKNNETNNSKNNFADQLKKQLADMTNNRKKMRDEIQKKVKSDDE